MPPAGVIVTHGLMTFMDGLRDRARPSGFLAMRPVDDAAKETTEGDRALYTLHRRNPARGRNGTDAIVGERRIQADRERPDFQALMRRGLLASELALRAFLVVVTLDPVRERGVEATAARSKTENRSGSSSKSLSRSAAAPTLLQPCVSLRRRIGSGELRRSSRPFSTRRRKDELQESRRRRGGSADRDPPELFRRRQPPIPSPVQNAFQQGVTRVTVVRRAIDNPARRSTPPRATAQVTQVAETATAVLSKGTATRSALSRSEGPRCVGQHVRVGAAEVADEQARRASDHLLEVLGMTASGKRRGRRWRLEPITSEPENKIAPPTAQRREFVMGLIVLGICSVCGLGGDRVVEPQLPGPTAQIGGLTRRRGPGHVGGFQRTWNASVVRFCLAAGKYVAAVRAITIALDLARRGRLRAAVSIPWWAHALVSAAAWSAWRSSPSRRGHRVCSTRFPTRPPAFTRVQRGRRRRRRGQHPAGWLGGTMLFVSGLDPVRLRASPSAASCLGYRRICGLRGRRGGAVGTWPSRPAIHADLLRGLPRRHHRQPGPHPATVERTNFADEDSIPPEYTALAKRRSGRRCRSSPWRSCCRGGHPDRRGHPRRHLWDTRMPPPGLPQTRGVLAVAMLIRMFPPQGAAMQGAFLAAGRQRWWGTPHQDHGRDRRHPGRSRGPWSLPASSSGRRSGAMVGTLVLAGLLYAPVRQGFGLRRQVLGAAVGLVGGLFVVLCVIAAGNLFAVAVPSTASSLAKPAAPARTSPASTAATAVAVPGIHTVGGAPAPPRPCAPRPGRHPGPPDLSSGGPEELGPRRLNGMDLDGTLSLFNPLRSRVEGFYYSVEG